MATLNSSNIVNNNVIQTNDLLQLYDALNYVGASTLYLVSLSGSLLGTASYATTASYALNGGGGGGGGVTQIITGSNITISPSTGVGAVTINATTPPGTFPYVGNAVITGSLIITGSDLGPDLIVTGSVIATQGFTGSLFGTAATASYVLNAINAVNAQTASYVVNAQTASYVTLSQTASYVTLAQTASFVLSTPSASNAISSQTSSKVIVVNNATTATSLPLIFAASNAAGTQQLNIDTDAGGPTYNPLFNSISSNRFTGSLLGTASYAISTSISTTALTSSQIQTVGNTTNAAHYLTFVDSNNGSPTAESLYTVGNTSINPSTGLLTTTTLSSTAITASSISASSFTGSLLGTSSFSTEAKQIQTVGNITNASHYLTFVDTNNSPATAEPLYTSAATSINPSTGLLTTTTLSSTAITASSITSSLTGSFRGTSSWSTAATQIQTVGTSTNALHYLTFVDANNGTPIAESLYTDGNINFNPFTNLLSVTGSITSSFTGSLLGTSSNANTASYANTASVPNTTTQWTSIGYSTTTYPIPAGRDVGVVFTVGNVGYRTFGLNTSSALIGDQVQIATVGTYTNGGLMKITATGSSAVSGTILVAGLSPSPNPYSNVAQTAWSPATNSGSQASWKFVCVKSSSKPIWQLVSYMDRGLGNQVLTYLDVLEIS